MSKNTEDIYKAMNNTHNCRNISVIAHVDAGKTTVTDSLLHRAGLLSDESTGVKRVTDTRIDEQQRGITIKSTGISLLYDYELDIPIDANGRRSNPESTKFLVNLIDSPGHSSFNHEVSAALRVTDGALIILDAVKGVCVQTITVIKQALDEMIIPVAMINKLDILIQTLQLGEEEFYQQLFRHINTLNATIAEHNHKLPEIVLKPEESTISFGCGIMGWGFTLKTFAKKWAEKLNMDHNELVKYLWGDNFYDTKTNTWHTTYKKGYIRGFTMCVTRPIMAIFKTIMNNPTDDYKTSAIIKNLVDNMRINLNDKQKDAIGKDLLKLVMQKFIPNSDALLEMIIVHLPSPIVAQKYRVDHLYSGPKGDKYYEGIKNCDPNGPLVMYVSKLFPSKDLSRFYAFGRVFSGKIEATNINIQSPDYIVGSPSNRYANIRVQNVCIAMGPKVESVPDCVAGNTISLAGIDKYILKTATIVNASSDVM